MHQFYKIQDLDFKTRKNILYDAKELCEKWHVDILDCSISIRRKKIDMGFHDIMAKFDKDCHFTIIHRKGMMLNEDDYLEIGFCTMNRPADYFLWIFLNEDKLSWFETKYNLEKS
jgi:hypothetical protein